MIDTKNSIQDIQKIKEVCDKHRYSFPLVNQQNLIAFIYDKFFQIKKHFSSEVRTIEQLQSSLIAQIAEHQNWQSILEAIERFNIANFITNQNQVLIQDVATLLQKIRDVINDKKCAIVFRLETKEELIFYKTSYSLFLTSQLHQELLTSIEEKNIFCRLNGSH